MKRVRLNRHVEVKCKANSFSFVNVWTNASDSGLPKAILIQETLLSTVLHNRALNNQNSFHLLVSPG